MMIGTSVVVIDAKRATPSSEMVPSINPSSIDPESPMKMLAGLKLKNRNAMQTAAKTMAMSAARLFDIVVIMTNSVSAEMAVMPAASPSSPSIRLMTLTKATR